VPADYALLAPIYSVLALDNFAETMTPRLIELAHQNDWMGRRILELGCGTGVTLEWLTRHNYIVRGIDQSPEMLEIARQRLEAANLHHDLQQQDARHMDVAPGTMDLVVALDLINELNSLRDLESVFNTAHTALTDGRLFLLDMHTIQGLTERGLTGDEIVHDSPERVVVSSNTYDYDRQIHERKYLIFHQDTGTWQRGEASRTLRGYPTQAVATLLQRCGFELRRVTDDRLVDFEPGVSQARRVIFLAQKQA
jgi:2-polyprenyl-3-methyl-5-hydroxy-6-metoxy-1,4-benzoquinol methylase